MRYQCVLKLSAAAAAAAAPHAGSHRTVCLNIVSTSGMLHVTLHNMRCTQKPAISSSSRHNATSNGARASHHSPILQLRAWIVYACVWRGICIRAIYVTYVACNEQPRARQHVSVFVSRTHTDRPSAVSQTEPRRLSADWVDDCRCTATAIRLLSAAHPHGPTVRFPFVRKPSCSLFFLCSSVIVAAAAALKNGARRKERKKHHEYIRKKKEKNTFASFALYIVSCLVQHNRGRQQHKPIIIIKKK